ncbi:MAG: YopX family protein [Capnocytophaga felis]|nr:YopX family protein [Capnocytophaga felis]
MKREIKFRAQRKDNKWQYSMTLSTGKEIGGATKSYDYFMAEKGKGWVKVKAETIGQFTGLYDKNGKEIYEGDVISIFGKNHAVKFKDGMFTINDREMRRYIHSIPLEVIGNVYENPELVK